MTATILQSAFGSGSSGSSITLALGSTPTVGNTLVLAVAGYSTAPTFPSGFIAAVSDGDQAFQGIWLLYLPVTSGTGSSFAVTGLTDNYKAALFETNGYISGYGFKGVAGTTITTPDLTAQPCDARLIIMEWDNANVAPTSPTGWTLLSPSSWFTSATVNHCSAIWQIPASATGTTDITMSASANYPVFLSVSLTAPTSNIVQYNTAQSSAGLDNPTMMLGEQPTIGNTLLLLGIGRGGDGGGTASAPSGYTVLYNDETSTAYQGAFAWSRTLVSGDNVSSYRSAQITGPTDTVTGMLIETTVSGFSISSGAMTGAGTTTIGFTAAAPGSRTSYRIVAIEFDNNGPMPTTPSGWTLLSMASFYGTSAPRNHNAAYYSVPVSMSGAQSITMSASTSYPIYMDVQFTGADPNPPTNVTQLGAEIWAVNSAPKVKATQLGAEVWIDTSMRLFLSNDQAFILVTT